MKHKASKKFWKLYFQLPAEIQKAADQSYELLKRNPAHPSLYFKALAGSNYYSVRVNDGFRAVAVKFDDHYLWFWIGTHDEYLRIIRA